MKTIRKLLDATATGGVALLVLTRDDHWQLQQEAAAQGAKCDSVNGVPIVAAKVQNSCLLRQDLSVELLDL